MTLHFEPLKTTHYPEIEAIINEAWHYEEFASPTVAKRLAKSFLAGCLTDFTNSQVAILDGHVVGAILVKNEKEHRLSLKYRLNNLASIAILMSSKEGRKLNNIFAYVETIDHQLMSEVKKTYSGQISLFVVSEKAQGLGIGKQLFQFALDYFNEQQLPNFYLYTDTTCNYGFYDHQGMTAQAQKVHHFTQLADTPTTTFFLYDYEL